MKTLPFDLAAHLEGGVTTLAWCWILTRKDGLRLGFTAHDRPLTVDGVNCVPENGLEATSRTSGPGLAAGAGEVAGSLTSAALSDHDLEAGYWDEAKVDAYLVNWSDPNQTVLLHRARIGEVRRQGEAFQAELRGLSHLLNRQQGRVFSRHCLADLGDSRCRVDLSQASYSSETPISEVANDGRIGVDGLSQFAAGWFAGGRLEVLSGPQAGYRSEIAAHQLLSGRAWLTLWQAPPRLLETGVIIKVRAGCDKRYRTCLEKFDNGLNFQGFPHMPGTDFVLSYPTRNTGENDGGILVP